MQRPVRERASSPRGGRARPERERARRIPVAMPEPARAAEWLRNFRLSGFALSILVLVVASLVVLAPSLKILVEQQQQIAALEQEVQDAQADVDDLGAEIDRWSDPAYIEAQARDRLYYVYPGDVTFLVIGGAATGADDGPAVSDEIQTTDVDWVTALLATVYQAGLTDAEPDDLLAAPEG